MHDLSRLRIERGRPPQGVRKGLRWGALAGLAIAAVAVVVFLATRARAGTEVQVALAELRGGSVGASTGVTANGYVVARRKASVSSKIAGRLEYLGVAEGSVVKEGEVIARLESRDYAAALEQREAEYVTARAAHAEAVAQRDQLARDLARAEQLLAQGLAATQEVERFRAELAAAEARVRLREAQVEAARAAVEVARANLENTYIRAPFDGTVLRKDAEVGEIVAPAVAGEGLTRGAVVTMADLETLEVEVDVNEAYIARVRHGQPARITLDAYPDTSFAGRVRQIVPTADRQKATVLVKVSILDRDPRILPEMGARVEFLEGGGGELGASKSRVFVPAAAVRDEGGEQVVWRVRDGRLERLEVDAGPVTGEVREIRTGLSGGEQVVVAARTPLREGARVRVVSSGT